jgi:hypothetical protein
MAEIQTSEVDAQIHQPARGHEMLYADRSSKDEQLLMRPVLLKAKTANMVGGLKLQFAFLCGDNI